MPQPFTPTPPLVAPKNPGTLCLRLVNACILGIVLTPIAIVIASSFSDSAYEFFPPVGFSFRWYYNFFESSEFTSALRTSFLLAVTTSSLSLLLGVPLSVVLVRHNFRGKEILSTLFLLPMLFPAIVLGIALLIFFSRVGLYGTFWGLVLGQLVITTPYVVRTVSSTLYGVSPSLEEAAMSLGATRFRTLVTVTLPLIKPGVISGAMFAFIISFDELVVSIFIAGPRMSTLPIRIFSYLEYSLDPTVAAIATIVIGVMTFVLFAAPNNWLNVMGRVATGRRT